jgi:hypothetical protein
MQFVSMFLFLFLPLAALCILPNVPGTVKKVALKALVVIIAVVQFVLDESAAMWAEGTAVLVKKLEKLTEESQSW